MIATHHPVRPTDAPKSQRGFALLLVIWVLALLALLAAGVAADTSSETVIARNRLDIASARDAAESGVSLAILGLLDPDPTKRLPADGSLKNFQFGNTIVAVSIANEGGKIDLNTAPANLIGGLADESASTLPTAARCLPASPRGAPASRRSPIAPRCPCPSPAISKAPIPAGSALQAFADTSEILSLPGLSHDAATRLLPYLTVYSQLATINPLTAPREVLLAVPGIGPEEVDFFLNGRHQTGFEKPALSGVDRYVAVTPPRAITITARSHTETASFTREAVVLISGNLSLQPYRILRWQQPRETPPSLGGGVVARRGSPRADRSSSRLPKRNSCCSPPLATTTRSGSIERTAQPSTDWPSCRCTIFAGLPWAISTSRDPGVTTMPASTSADQEPSVSLACGAGRRSGEKSGRSVTAEKLASGASEKTGAGSAALAVAAGVSASPAGDPAGALHSSTTSKPRPAASAVSAPASAS